MRTNFWALLHLLSCLQSPIFNYLLVLTPKVYRRLFYKFLWHIVSFLLISLIISFAFNKVVLLIDHLLLTFFLGLVKLVLIVIWSASSVWHILLLLNTESLLKTFLWIWLLGEGFIILLFLLLNPWFQTHFRIFIYIFGLENIHAAVSGSMGNVSKSIEIQSVILFRIGLKLLINVDQSLMTGLTFNWVNGRAI